MLPRLLQAADDHTVLAEGRSAAVCVGTVGVGLERYDPATGRSAWFRHTDRTGSLADDPNFQRASPSLQPWG